MTGCGLTGIYFLPQEQTLTADYYINNILEKEVRPVLHRKNVNGATDERKLFSSNHHMTFVLPRTQTSLFWWKFCLPSVPFPWSLAVHYQSLVSRSPLPCEKRSAWGGGWPSSKTGRQHTQPGPPRHGAKKGPVPNFIEKTCWPPNSPDINPVENLWSIMDEVVYKDPTPKTMKDLKRRLKQAWKKIPLSTLLDLSQSTQPPLRNVITNKAGHAGYWIFKYMYSVKQ